MSPVPGPGKSSNLLAAPAFAPLTFGGQRITFTTTEGAEPLLVTLNPEIKQYIRAWALLRNVTYRQGWSFTAYPNPVGEGCWIIIDARVPDAEDPAAWTRIGVRAVVPPYNSATEFYNWLAWRLQRIERHESREFFKVNGQPWDSPHKVEQPKHDYLVRRRRDENGTLIPGWTVVDHNGTTQGGGNWGDWRLAYNYAWHKVIQDDLAKTDELING